MSVGHAQFGQCSDVGSGDVFGCGVHAASAGAGQRPQMHRSLGGIPHPSQLIRFSKSSEESSTVASGARSVVGSSASSGTLRSSRSAIGFSKMKSRSRLRGGSLATTDAQNTEYSKVQEDAPKKKKPSIFGVARLIRKASVSVFSLFGWVGCLPGIVGCFGKGLSRFNSKIKTSA